MRVFPKVSSRVQIAAGLVLGQLCFMETAAAQLDYVSQSRSVSVTARSYATTVVPPANPSSGSPTYVTNGVTDVDSASSAVPDFGPFDRTVSASATYAASTSTVGATYQSSLGADGIRVSMNYSMERVGYNAVIESYADSASFLSTIQFTVNDTTTLAFYREISRSGESIPVTWFVNLTHGATGVVDDFFSSPDLQYATLTLAPGSYTLRANLYAINPLQSNVMQVSGMAAFNMVAVPEASTWSTMCIGLLGMAAWGARRRRTT